MLSIPDFHVSDPIFPDHIRLKGLFILCVLAAVVAISYVTSFLRLRHIKGPRWAAHSRIWLARALASGEAQKVYEDVNAKYGALARIGPNNLVTNDPDTMHRILDSHSRYIRSVGFDSFKHNPRLGNIISQQDPFKHDRLRRQLAAGYGGRDIDNAEANVDTCINELMGLLDQDWSSSFGDLTKTADLSKWIQYLTMDVITFLLFGEAFGYARTQTDVYGFLQIVQERLPIVEQFSLLTELCTVILGVSYVPWLKNILPSQRDEWGIGKVMNVADRVVGERMGSKSAEQNDILASFLRHGLTKEEAMSEITVSLFAGSDTTATSTRATLLNIITNPMVYRKLQQEIDDAISAGLISSPIQVAEAAKLPYLQACIKEGLRVFPPIGSLRERVVPPEGDIINGQRIPGGTNVGFNIRSMQQHEVFGTDPDIFRPERWLDVCSERMQKMVAIHDLIFGHGSTKCLGIRIAHLTLNKFFVELLRRFDVSVVNPYRPFEARCHQIYFVKELKVKLTRREQLKSG